MEHAPTGGLVERAVVEAIDALAVAKVRNAVLALALRWARHEVIPERGPEVGEFVSGALFAAAEQVLGQAAAESIEKQLLPVADMVAEQEVSSVRPSRPPKPDSDYPEVTYVAPPVVTPLVTARPAMPTTPAPAHLASVLVASVDPSGVSAMSLTLAGLATVYVVGDALEIIDELSHHEASLVVVDCRRPVVSVETLLALGPELPDDARIVLWGERQNLEQDLSGLGIELPDTWICCGPQATADDVGTVCRVLLD